MPRLPPAVPPAVLLVVVAILVAPVAAVVPGQAPADGPRETANGTEAITDVGNRTNYLMPDTDTVREEYGTASVDVSGAVAAGAHRLHGSYERGSFRRSWSGASEATKRRLVIAEFEDIRERLATLEAERDALWRAYRGDEVSTATLVRRTAIIDARGSQLLERIENVQQLLSVANEPPYVQDYLTPIDELRGQTSILMNQVGANLAGPLAGADEQRSVYVLFSERSLVVAETSDGQFTRLAHSSTNLVRNGTDRFAPPREISALTRFKELYPWADRNAIRSARVLPFGNTSVYRGRIVHPQGELRVFLDGGSRDVFRERQILRRETLPVEESLTNNTEELAITVNTTGPTGPMLVQLEQSGTRAPVNGTVRIDGTVVGTTGQSGSLWAVQPRDSFTVNATVGTDRITVSGS